MPKTGSSFRRYAGIEYFLPQCKGRWPGIWNFPAIRRCSNSGSQTERRHCSRHGETLSQRNRYCFHRQSGRRTFALANKTGGLSGPAILPIAIRMVYQVRQAVSIPILGMGGITTGEDAVEFLLAGANAIAVGSANFQNPYAPLLVRDGIASYMQENGISRVDRLTNGVQTWTPCRASCEEELT